MKAKRYVAWILTAIMCMNMTVPALGMTVENSGYEEDTSAGGESEKEEGTGFGDESETGEERSESDNESESEEEGTGFDNESESGEAGTDFDNESESGEEGSESDNESESGEEGSESDNESESGEEGTGSGDESESGEEGTGSDDESESGEEGTGSDDESETGEEGTGSGDESKSGDKVTDFDEEIAESEIIEDDLEKNMEDVFLNLDGCICESKCTEYFIDGDCPVCGQENADLSECLGEEVHVAAFTLVTEDEECICEKKCTEDNINEDCPVCSQENADLTECLGEGEKEEIVSIPDTALLQALIDNGYDIDGDGALSVSEMVNVTYLNARDYGISDLTGLEAAVNLGYVDLSYNNIISLEPLRELDGLYGHFNDNEIEDIAPLANKTEYLFLNNNNIKELPDLYAWVRHQLYNDNDPMNIFSGNIALTRDKFEGKFSVELTEEWLTVNAYDDTEVTIPDTALKQALIDNGYDLDGNGALSISEMRNITDLRADSYGISDLTGLEEAVNLAYVDFSNNNIMDLTPVQRADNIYGYFDRNKITDISALSGKAPAYIYLRYNCIEELPDLTTWTEETLYDDYIDADGSYVENEPRNIFSGNTGLTRADFEGKFSVELTEKWLLINSYDDTEVAIPDVALKQALINNGYDLDEDGLLSISEMRNVTELWASNYGISNLSGLESAVNLGFVELSGNNIIDLEPLRELKHIYGYFNNNEIADIAPLANITGFIYLRDNNINELPDLTAWKEEQLYYGDNDPINIFGGNTALTRDKFEGKFSVVLTEEWLARNAYDDTEVLIPDAALKQAIIEQGDDKDGDGSLSVSEMQSVSGVYGSSRGICNLTGLEAALNLDYVDLSYNDITDLSPLRGLHFEGKLNDNQISDISPLAGSMTGPVYLNNNNISEIPDLSAWDEYMLYDGYWGSEGYTILKARNIFGGNTDLTVDSFTGKFSVELTEEWLNINTGEYWVETEDGRMFYRNGIPVTDEYVNYCGDTYYLDENGYMYTGWLTVPDETGESIRYRYFNSEGKMRKSNSFKLKTINGKEYAFDSEGFMLYGWVSSAENRTLTEMEGWKEADYYFGEPNDGALKTGWVKLNVYGGWKNTTGYSDHYFYFSCNDIGKKCTGWLYLGDTGYYYWLDDTGARLEGLKEVDGNLYYFDKSDGHMLASTTVTVDSVIYVIDENGVATASGEVTEEWVDTGEGRMFYRNGVAVKDEYVEYNGAIYYLDENGYMYTGWLSVIDEADGSTRYRFFNSEGKMRKYDSFQLKMVNGKYYAFDSEGFMLYGWVSSAENRTLTEPEGWKEADHYFGEPDDGSLKTGWVKLSVYGGWKNAEGYADYYFYFDPDNSGQKWIGWLTTEDGTYYLDGTGARLEGLKEVDGSLYYFDKLDGHMLTSTTVTVDSVVYVIDEYGIAVKAETPAAPIINKQPETLVDVQKNSRVSYSVEAENAASYQWYYSNDGGETWIMIYSWTGAQTNRLEFTALSERDGYQFRCVITGIEGTKVTTDAAGLSLVKAAKIVRQPESLTDILMGSKVSYSVEAENAAVYQWYYSSDNGETWTAIYSWTGAQTNVLEFTAISERDGYQFQCIVTGADGTKIATEAAGLSLAGAALIVAQPESISNVRMNSKVSYRVEAENVSAYQWYYSSDEGETWTAIYSWTGAKTNELEFTAIAERDNYQFRCTVTGMDGTKVTSEPAFLSLAGAVSIVKQPESLSGVKSNNRVSYSVEAENAASYQWYYSVDNGTSWTAIYSWSGAKTEQLEFTAIGERNGYLFRCAVTGYDGTRIYTESAGLSLAEGAVIVDQPVSLNDVVQDTKVSYRVKAENAVSYQWYYSDDNGTTWTAIYSWSGARTEELTFTAIRGRNGYLFHCVVTGQDGEKVTSESASLILK